MKLKSICMTYGRNFSHRYKYLSKMIVFLTWVDTRYLLQRPYRNCVSTPDFKTFLFLMFIKILPSKNLRSNLRCDSHHQKLITTVLLMVNPMRTPVSNISFAGYFSSSACILFLGSTWSGT